MKEAALIVFQKKAVPGKVKTRLARTIGNEKAVLVYNHLLAHTHQELLKMEIPVIIFFDKEIQPEYLHQGRFLGLLQSSGDLGERMKNAFSEVFQMGFKKAIIIGTDCMELDSAVLAQAIEELDQRDLVIGPAMDGGYYLLGMKSLHKKLFENKKWSAETVYRETVRDAGMLDLKIVTLKTLSDVDTFEDLGTLARLLDLKS